MLPGTRYPAGPLLSRIEQIDDADVEQECFLKLATARVALIDYDLLQQDFVFLRNEEILRRHPEWSNLPSSVQQVRIREYIKQWFLTESALISSSQANQNVVNTPILTNGESVVAYRPPRYRRACVVPCRSSNRPDAQSGELAGDGLLDVKGVGLPPKEIPAHGDHSDGLAILGRIFRDTAMQWLIDEVFARTCPALWTVPVYGVIDSGFDYRLEGKRGVTPAGLQIRRAHRRPLRGVELPEIGTPLEYLKFEIEMLLRTFGITSSSVDQHIALSERDGTLNVEFCGKTVNGYSTQQLNWIRRITGYTGGKQCNDVVNIQITRDFDYSALSAQLVDFEHFAVRDNFDKPVVSLVLNHLLNWGGVVRPNDECFVRPRQSGRVNFETWGLRKDWREIEPIENMPFDSASRLDAIAFRLARMFRSGEIDEEHVREALRVEVASALT